MKRMRIAVHLTLVLAVAFSVIAFFVPTEAKAFNLRRVTEYYGYAQANGTYGCENTMIISPPAPRELVGERVRECDGSVYQWGIVCDDAESYSEWCDY